MARFEAFVTPPAGRTAGVFLGHTGWIGVNTSTRLVNANLVEITEFSLLGSATGVVRFEGAFTSTQIGGRVPAIEGSFTAVTRTTAQGATLFTLTEFAPLSIGALRDPNSAMSWILAGADSFRGSPLNDTLVAGGGGDIIQAGAGADSLLGEAGNDLIEGGAGADTILGGDGYDILDYRNSPSGVSLNLASGIGWSGDAAGDVLASLETVFGSPFADFIAGSEDHNVIEGGAGADSMLGLGGNDWVSYESATGPVAINTAAGGWAGDATGDVVSGIENIRGSAFGDYLFGDDGANILRGDGGADVLYGAGNSDTIYYSTSAVAVFVDLSTNSASGGDADGDTLVSVENVFATAHRDRLIGDSASNTLVGWLGADTLTGNGGNDIFRFAETDAQDLVTDFWRVHGDLLDVSGYGVGSAAFTFRGTAGPTGSMQLGYTVQGGFTDVWVNVDGQVHTPIRLVGTIALLASDFIL